MKKYKGLLAVLIAVALLFSLAACAGNSGKSEKVTVAVTNENGEYVTDENGELVTEEVEAEVVTNENGEVVTEIVTDANGKPVTTVVDGKYQNVTQVVTGASSSNSANNNSTKNTTVKSTKKSETTAKKNNSSTKKGTDNSDTIKKPSAPKNVSKLEADRVKTESLRLKWGKVSCDGYQVQQFANGEWVYLTKNTTSTSLTVKELVSFTSYQFRVRAFNKNSAGTTASSWKTVSVTTKAADTSRKITLTVLLPVKSGEEDTLTIYVDGKVVETKTVKLDGTEYVFTTKDKYKGKVSVKAELKKARTSDTKETDKAAEILDLTAIGIQIIPGEDD